MGLSHGPMLTVLATAVWTVFVRYRSLHHDSETYVPSLALTVFVLLPLLEFLRWLVWSVVVYPRFVDPLRRLPQPSKGNSFFFGQFPTILAQPSGHPLAVWVNTIPNDGFIYYRGIFNSPRLIPTSPKALSEILTTKNYEFIKPEQVRAGIGRLLGIGVLLAEGEEHKRQRKNLTPAFAYRHIKDLYPVFWAKGCEMIAGITAEIEAGVKEAAADETQTASVEEQSKETEDSPAPSPQPGSRDALETKFEISQWASRATLDIIGVAGLGRDFDSIANPSNKLYQTYKHIFQPTTGAQIMGLISFVLPGWAMPFIPMQRNSDIRAAVKVIRGVCHEAIERKKQILREWETANQDSKRGHDEKATKPALGRDVLSVALTSGAFTDEELVNQLLTFLAAGHETTATALTWAVYALAKYPAVQEKLRQEIRTQLPSPSTSETDVINSSISQSSRQLDAALLDSLPYLTAVTNEILRCFPPVPLTPRESRTDVVVAGQLIPKGTRIMLVPWAINKSPALWGEDAAEFKPERWLNMSLSTKAISSTLDPATSSSPSAKATDPPAVTNGSASAKAINGGTKPTAVNGNTATTDPITPSNYAFLTFLHGPRACIGERFTRAEFKALLACFVGRVAFRLDHPDWEPKVKGGITAKPVGGVEVWAKVLKGW